MRTLNFLCMLSLCFCGLLTQAQSFRSGNNFQSIPIYGDVSVDCHGPNGEFMTNYFRCEDLRLAPAEVDYFVGPKLDADKVRLTSQRADGKTLSKEEPYQKGQSTGRFNLWLQSLFQNPLLDEGVNKISFDLTKQGKLVSHGEMEIKVTRGAAKSCPHGFITSYNMSDCSSSFSACQSYFQQYNYCF